MEKSIREKQFAAASRPQKKAAKSVPQPAVVSLSSITGDALLAQKNLLKSSKKETKEEVAAKLSRVGGKENSPIKPNDSLMVALQKKFKQRNRRESADRRLSLEWDNTDDEE